MGHELLLLHMDQVPCMTRWTLPATVCVWGEGQGQKGRNPHPPQIVFLLLLTPDLKLPMTDKIFSLTPPPATDHGEPALGQASDHCVCVFVCEGENESV